MVSDLINANPVVYEKKDRRSRSVTSGVDEYSAEPIDQLEIFDHLRDIKDPEHPYSLEELKVITESAIEVDDKNSYVRVTFTPTVEHCSLAAAIGLCLRVKLMRCLPSRYKERVMMVDPILCIKEEVEWSLFNLFKLLDVVCPKVDIRVAPGSHATEAAVNKQLNDKERVAAALESPALQELVEECLAPSFE